MKHHLLIPLSAAAYALVAAVLILDMSGTPIAYVAYLASAIALAVDLAVIIPAAVRAVKAGMMRTRLGRRFLTDFLFRQRLFLFGSLGMNAVYALMNLVSGISGRSAWAISFAVYYLAIGSVRLLLFRSLSRDGFGRELMRESRRYFVCGAAVMIMAVPFAGIVTLMVRSNMSRHYSQNMLFAMAGYVFYAVISCAVKIIRYRKYKSPVLSAAKRISFIAALVSMIGLETAMLEQYNTDPVFRNELVSRTGIVILAIIAIVGAEMMIRGRLWMRKYADPPEKNEP